MHLLKVLTTLDDFVQVTVATISVSMDLDFQVPAQPVQINVCCQWQHS